MLCVVINDIHAHKLHELFAQPLQLPRRCRKFVKALVLLKVPIYTKCMSDSNFQGRLNNQINNQDFFVNLPSDVNRTPAKIPGSIAPVRRIFDKTSEILNTEDCEKKVITLDLQSNHAHPVTHLTLVINTDSLRQGNRGPEKRYVSRYARVES
ncbi:hypothetical protein BDZ45DRAFT_494879 [Acephala macrosclerotiorum]|nr:hypothetical protein BDZ45DRAFT_494879 [Acephala macrosclerotiorum]